MSEVRASRRRLSAGTSRKLEGLLFISPWLFGFVAFMAFPIGYSFYMSFHNVKIQASGVSSTYAGLKHYKYILFENATLLYDQLLPFLRQALVMLPVIVIFSLLAAILLNQRFAGRSLFRAVFFLPVIFTTGEVISEFIGQGQGSLGFVSRFGFDSTLASAGSWTAPVAAVMNSFILVLWYSGVQIMIFLAGRQTIGTSVYEAARIDGAGPWEAFWKITLPGMLSFILLNLIYTTVSLFTFPTNPILLQVNTVNYGQSSALAWIYFAIVLLFLGVMFGLFKRAVRWTG
ncbi:carbohydrate ABC transporter permease [Paenibacillus cymbidii]|uniref:carbohydrate ABC transporter permease n=1 Tax=Paenibacillus cymbidii TaxID=1639034 RepID=UPI001082172B|nr:sugar ABC transporter permease [Paenibacillus cymbidii]